MLGLSVKFGDLFSKNDVMPSRASDDLPIDRISFFTYNF